MLGRFLSLWSHGGSSSSPPWDGKPVDDAELYWARARAEFAARQRRVAKQYGLSGAAWQVDQNAGLIWFYRPDGAVLRAPVQIVGSWNPRAETFTWGWDHPSVHTRLRSAAEHTRWFGDKHAIAPLTDRQIAADETEAWTYTALAWKLDGAVGAYRGPIDHGPVLFMTLGEIRRE